MTIELDGFVIEGSKRIGKFSKFDLYSLHERKEGKKKGEIVRRAEWYDTSLEKCLKRVLEIRQQSLGKLSMDEYLEQYNAIVDKFTEELKLVTDKLQELILSNESQK